MLVWPINSKRLSHSVRTKIRKPETVCKNTRALGRDRKICTSDPFTPIPPRCRDCALSDIITLHPGSTQQSCYFMFTYSCSILTAVRFSVKQSRGESSNLPAPTQGACLLAGRTHTSPLAKPVMSVPISTCRSSMDALSACLLFRPRLASPSPKSTSLKTPPDYVWFALSGPIVV